MSHTNELNPFEGLVFYVNEPGEDFTFYLDVRSNIEVLRSLKSLQKGRDDKRTDRYSFVGEISFLEDDGLKAISDSFWAKLDNPACKSLLHRLRRAASESEAEDGTSIQQMLKQPEQLNNREKQVLLPLFTKVLFDATLGALESSQPGEHRSNPQTEEGQGEFDREQIRPPQRRFFEVAFPEVQGKIRRGRGLICLSHAGRYLSISVRKLGSKGSYQAEPYKKEDQDERKRRLFSLGEYCDLIYDEIFTKTNSTNNAHGLLIITGSTNSAKSEIARGLIDRYLINQEKKQRRHHLVTFEDPIERLYVEEVAEGSAFVAAPMKAKAMDKDYTPREKRKDVGRLEKALQDALRQTPSILFVGETRRKDEWELLLDFAATGHLIVTTAHAGSLVEAMHKIFEARGVKTPADRSEIANKLLGVVHLGSHRLKIVPQVFQAADFVFPDNQLRDSSMTTCPGDRFKSAHQLLVDCLVSGEPGPQPTRELVDEFNKLLDDDSLRDDGAFKNLDQSNEIEKLQSLPKTKRTSGIINRLLLERLYHREISRRRITPQTLFPALWRRTARGVAGLTSDGLASLLPHRPGKDKTEVPSCVGRRWSIEWLLENAGDLRPVFAEYEIESVKEQSFRKAIEWDLQGV